VETERLRLRRFTGDDVELLVALDSDPEVMRFLTGQPTPPEEIANVVLPAILKVYDEHPGLGTFAAEQRSDGAFIGWFGLQPTAVPGTEFGEVEYAVDRRTWEAGRRA
jgi:RimJ/RimL family protein N-acetyltransferase